MSQKLIVGMPGSPSGNTRNRPKSAPEHIGDCVVCKGGIFSNDEWGRAPRPLLGKAHTRCGGA